MGPPLPPSHKRGHDAEDDAGDVGPPRPPEGLVADDDDGDQAGQDGEAAPGPALPPAKRKRVLEHEAVYLAALPSAEMYEKSFMHRDTITHVVRAHSRDSTTRHGWCTAPLCRLCLLSPLHPVPPQLSQVSTPRTEFFVTASVDGHVKFWKKKAQGVEFVKHYRSHPGLVTDVAASHDGEHLLTVGPERAAKVYDVLSFDMMGIFRLAFTPGCCCWIYSRGDPALKLAIGDADSPAIHVFDARDVGAAASGPSGAATPLATLTTLHSSPVKVMRLNPTARTVISGDAKGVLEVWSADDYGFPGEGKVSFRFKADTDLYAHAKAKTWPFSLEVSPDGSQFATFSRDRRVRVFRFATGKLRCVIDESLDAAAETQRAGQAAHRLDDIDYGRRMAVERELDKEWALPGGSPTVPPPNVLFDESGNFVAYATHLGIKLVNLVTSRCVALLGRVENNERFLRIALFQGVPGKDKRVRGATDDTAAKARQQAMAAGAGAPGGPGGPTAGTGLLPDPTFAACAFRKHRVYFFSRREPVDSDDVANVRDVFNERPLAEEIAAAHALAAGGGAGGRGALPQSATIHTTVGDISIKLYGAECPRTVENWTTHARNGYYDNLLFHRCIKGFMIQTGDPLGDGTGGQSIWGGRLRGRVPARPAPRPAVHREHGQRGAQHQRQPGARTRCCSCS